MNCNYNLYKNNIKSMPKEEKSNTKSPLKSFY